MAAEIIVDESKEAREEEMGQAPSTATFVMLKTIFHQDEPNEGNNMSTPRHNCGLVRVKHTEVRRHPEKVT